MSMTRNILSDNARTQSSALLNQHLAAAIDLHAQVKQAHWNVRGATFIGLHELFDTISTEVEDWSDLLAERAGALGAAAAGTIQQAVARSHLAPYPLMIANGPAHLDALCRALGGFASQAQEAIGVADSLGDPVTADVFTGIVRAADAALWKLESHQEPT